MSISLSGFGAHHNILIQDCNFVTESHKNGTLDYEISVPSGINMPVGTFGKISKCASWKTTLSC